MACWDDYPVGLKPCSIETWPSYDSSEDAMPGDWLTAGNRFSLIPIDIAFFIVTWNVEG